MSSRDYFAKLATDIAAGRELPEELVIRIPREEWEKLVPPGPSCISRIRYSSLPGIAISRWYQVFPSGVMA